VTAIAINSSNPANIYLGAAQGGVWKSVDGGTTWTPLTDSQSSLTVGAITISPDTKTIFVGTGEPNQSGDSYFGNGLLKSTDGGRTWTLLGSTVFSDSAISGIVLVGGSQNRLLVSTTWASCCGRAYAIQNQAGVGVFLSTDGGQSWTRTLLSNNYVGVSQILADPTNTARIYAADFAGKVWESTDGGSTWSGLRAYSQTSQQGRAVVAASAASPNNLLMAFADSTASLIGIFRLDVSSNAITTLGNPPTPAKTNGPCNGQCDYDFVLSQDQSNANVIFLGTVDLFKSSDGGQTWTDLGGYGGGNLHPDQHAIAFSPGSPITVYSGNDGGIWKTTDGGATWTNLNDGLGITQFYSIAGSLSSVLIGGTQDNGCVQYKGFPSWSLVQGGDGGWTGFESTNTNIMYCNFTHLNFQKSTDGGRTWNDAVTGLNLNDKSLFFAPTVQDPNNPGTIYICSIRVYKTTNFAQSWSDVSGVLGTAKISAVALAPTSSNTLYIGDTSGVVRVSSDGGATWQQVASKTYSVTSIAVDPGDANVVYVAFAELGLYKISLSGGTWQSAALSPPQAARVDVIRLNPTTKAIYIGTDLGVYYSADSGASWATVGSGLPNAAVFDLDYVSAANQLIAATHGRGVWVVSFAQPVRLTASFSVQGGGAGYSLPVLSYVYNGLQLSATLTTSPAAYTLDSGTSWNIANPLTGSSNSERWQTIQTASGTATSAQTISMVYYHQFNVPFNYAVNDQSSGYFSPTFSYIQFSSSSSATSGSIVWVDANSAYSYQVQLTGSSQNERWLTNAPSGTVASSAGITISYYHQYLENVSYTVFGGGTPGAPTFTSTSLGSPTSITLSGTSSALWLDSGASYSAMNPLPGSSSTERWFLQNASGTFRSSTAIVFVFHHQYYLNVAPTGSVRSITPPSVTGDAGWYDSGTAVTISYDHVWNVVAGQSRLTAVGYSIEAGHFTPIPEAGSGTFDVSLTMNSPHTVALKSVTQYYLTFSFANAAGTKTISPTSLQIAVNGQIQDVPGLTAWLDSGTTLAISQVLYEEVDVRPAAAALYSVTAPATITVKANVHDATVRVTDLLGFAVSGAQVKMTLANGTVVSGTTGGDGSFTAAQIPLGTFTVAVSSLGSSAQVRGDASKQNVTPASVLFGTTSLGIIIAIAVVAIVGGVFVLRRRRSG